MASGKAKGEEFFQDVTAEGGVSKKILTEGKGEWPSLHATCLVHYIGRLDETDSVFVDTRSEGPPVKIVAGRDSILRNAGINLAVAKMRAGEVAFVRIKPEYGYGTQGSFSFPSVPPNSCLTYEIELIQFDSVVEGKSSSEMLYEERLEAAERRRLDGNALFKAGEMTDALGKYAMALSYLDQDFMFQLQGAHEDKANAIRVPILLNMSACHLNLSDFKGAIEASSEVLRCSSKNAKALFRRGKAYRLAGQNEKAFADLTAARTLFPQDRLVLQELQALKRTMSEESKTSGEIFRGFLPSVKPSICKTDSFWKRLWHRLQRFLASLWRSDSQHLHSQ